MVRVVRYWKIIREKKGVSLKIEWIEMDSYANETPTCMFAGAVRREDGELKSWKSFESQGLVNESLMVIKQDIKLLGTKLMPLWIRHIKSCLNKHGMSSEDVDYVIPHSSSMVIYNNLIEAMKNESFELYKKRVVYQSYLGGKHRIVSDTGCLG